MFLDLPLVPGSGREVPPWVLAGPVIRRLKDLLEHLRPGYVVRDEVRGHPRGQIQWHTYLTRQMPSGRWHHLPCRFSELDTDSRLRQVVRWTLERLYADLGSAGGRDPVALSLIRQIVLLLEHVLDVPARRPLRAELEQNLGSSPMASQALREGLRAIGWIVDERGLGGGRTSDGLAWTLPLEQLWERYVESLVREEAARSGGRVRVGRLGETVVPLAWNDPSHRALGHLVPDFVVHRHDGIEVIDAKYKSHFADLDANRWSALAEETQQSVRADLHQVLAYAAATGSSDQMGATLIYPVRRRLYEDLKRYGRAETRAAISVGQRQITLRMKAVAFGT
ncbi:MAG: McrC family protein [Gammaproteobacteria bacterium]|nr:McrC family protein [Gammaproteobacteria bacterium]